MQLLTQYIVQRMPSFHKIVANKNSWLLCTLMLSLPALSAHEFYSMKRGTGNSSADKPLQKLRVEAINASWYYSWSMDRNFDIDPALEYVPAKHAKYWPNMSELANSGDFKNLITWNEPYMQHLQNDPTPEQAFDLWPEIETAANQYGMEGVRIASPTTKGVGDMFQLAFTDIAMQAPYNYQIDWISNHKYPKPTQLFNKLKRDAEELYAKYNMPIWQTEFNGADWDHTRTDWTAEHNYTQLIDVLFFYETSPIIERYAIFPWDDNWEVATHAKSQIYQVGEFDIDTGKFASTATLTLYGKLYAQYRSGDIYGPYLQTVYYLHNKGSMKRLYNDAGTSSLVGIATEGAAAEFELVDSGTNNGAVHIKNRHSGEYLQYTGSAISWSMATDSNAQWQITPANDAWSTISSLAYPDKILSSLGETVTVEDISVDANSVKWAMVRSGTPYLSGGSHTPIFSQENISKANAIIDTLYNDTLAGTATDADGDPIIYMPISGPTWLNISADGKLFGTPTTDDQGLNTWTVQASDGKGNAVTTNITLTVELIPETPNVEPIPETPNVEPTPETPNNEGGGGGAINGLYLLLLLLVQWIRLKPDTRCFNKK